MPTDPSHPPAIVVMGVSGSGKTSIGRRLAQVLGGRFVDGDDLHSDEARAKMREGRALDDDDRWPWLDRVGATLREVEREGHAVVVACSALKKRYRDRIRAAAGPTLRFVYLAAEPEAMRARVGARAGHYMPASLVDSQFAALEAPVGEADVVTVLADGPIESEVAALARMLASSAP